MNKLISIVIPAFQEENNINFLYLELNNLLKNISDKYYYEIIFVNDGSQDMTWQEIVKLALLDKNIKGIDMSRNFGKELALTAGIQAANGNCVITLDCDGQHPVTKIPEFIQEWENGYDIVYNIRPKTQNVSWIKKYSSLLFYKIFNLISDFKLESGVTDFRLIDRKVITEFLKFQEKNRIFRGIIDYMGFKRKGLVFDALPNQAGRVPSYNYLKLYNLAINSITSFTVFPLKFVGYLGLFITFISFLLLIIMFFDRMGFLRMNFSNLAILAVFNTLFIGIVLISLGLIAVYIANIHNEVSGRPLYIIRDKINF